MKKKNFKMVVVAACAAVAFFVPVMPKIMEPVSVQAAATGWIDTKDGWKYKNQDGSYVTSRLKTIGSTTYYFNEKGIMATGWKKINNKWYYFLENGSMKKGWIKLDNIWYYLQSDGVMASSTFINNQYLIKANGAMASNEWVKLGGKWYFVNTEGIPLKSKWYQYKNLWYYFDANGVMSSSTFVSNKFYVKASGAMATNEWALFEGKWYYILENGTRKVNGWLNSKGIWYFLETDGAMATNKWIQGRYYVSNKGAMVTGWLNYKDARYYLHTTSGAYVKGLQIIDGQTYYFANGGALQHGWLELDGKKYYADDKTGAFTKGWKLSDNKWYLFNSQGVLLKGWQKQGTSWYYLKADGTMATDWTQVGSKWYYLNPGSGIMKTGWFKWKEKWYYLKPAPAGDMAIGWYKVSGKWYYFEGSGIMRANAWVGANYYVGPNGDMYESKNISIGGIPYRFGADGKNIPFIKYKEPSTGRTFYLEPTFNTDPQIGTGAGKVSLEDFLTASVYTEAGDQGDIGMQAVALVMLNRLKDKEFPNDLRVLMYQANQYAIARDGFDGSIAPLTRVLKDERLKNKTFSYYEKARASSKAAQTIMDNYNKTGAKRIIPGFPLPAGYPEFDYLFFMTPAAFDRLEASGSLNRNVVGGFTSYTPDIKKTTGHVFFRYWRSK